MADKVGLAVAGLGWWGNVLTEAAGASRAEIVVGYARTRESRQAFTVKHGVRTCDSYETLLQDPEVEGVLLATPHSTHADYIVAAATAGKHVFVEKPMTLTVEEGKRAIGAAEKAGVVLQVGHNRRRQPANRRIKQMIDSGQLGTVALVETQWSMPNSLSFQPDYWRADPRESPLGGMASLGTHMIDTMHYLLGPIERVFAFSTVLLDHAPIDDATTVVVEFASGQLGYLGTSFVVPRQVSVIVRGTDYSAKNDGDGTRFYVQGRLDSEPTEQPIETLDTVADQLSEFVRAIRGEVMPETGGAEGLEVIAVLEAATASSVSGRAETVADFR